MKSLRTTLNTALCTMIAAFGFNSCSNSPEVLYGPAPIEDKYGVPQEEWVDLDENNDSTQTSVNNED